MFDIKRQSGESEEKYIWRLGQAKDNQLIDLDWQSIGDLINREFREDETEYRSESAYRKIYQMAKRMYDAGVFTSAADESYLQEITLQKHELEKERVKVRDERNELKRILRETARQENFIEQISRAVQEHAHESLFPEPTVKPNIEKQNVDMIIPLMDIHGGINISNPFNYYNPEILKERMQQYLHKIQEIQIRHGCNNAYVILSELISGFIHNELRIESNQNIIEQFLMVCDYISDFLYELSSCFYAVHVYMCPGNHSRLHEDKKKSLKGENIDHLAIPYLEAKLQNITNIEFHKNQIDESIADFWIRDLYVMAAHGDKDEPANVVQKFSMFTGTIPDIVYLGHRHTNGLSTVYDTKVIQSGCLSGSDSYCMDKRLRNRPEQIVSIVSDNGLECTYDVKFD